MQQLNFYLFDALDVELHIDDFELLTLLGGDVCSEGSLELR